MSLVEKHGRQSHPKYVSFYVLFSFFSFFLVVLKWKLELYLCLPAKTRLFVCLFGCFGLLWASGTQELLECGCVSVLRWAVSLICSFNLRVALQLREPNSSPSSSLLLLASYDVCSSEPSSPSRGFSLFSFFLGKGWSRRMEAGGRCAAEASQRGPTVGIVSEPETIFTAALSGRPGNKASIDPPNEPTQQSLLLDLYLLKSGQEKSSSFSTFPGICRLIDCFSRAFVHLLECLGLKKI